MEAVRAARGEVCDLQAKVKVLTTSVSGWEAQAKIDGQFNRNYGWIYWLEALICFTILRLDKSLRLNWMRNVAYTLC